MKYLIVDDTSIVRDVLATFIGEMGDNQCVEAQNGAEAWDLLSNELFDFVITDITMPVMDGWDLLAEIRTNLRLKNIPVLIITGTVGVQESARAANSGADGILQKPFTRATLHGKIESILASANYSVA